MSSKEMAALKDESVLPGSDSEVISDSIEDQVILLVARLMEGGQEDDDTCRTLDKLTKLLTEVSVYVPRGQQEPKPLHELIDTDGFGTILGCLDMREGQVIRGHATLTVSAYLKASGQSGADYLSFFFKSRISKGTYDDFLVAFSVAACIFPLVPSVSAELFLSEGFVNSLGSLMRRKWKSKKVEQACLEMLNAASMDAACREAIRKYCTEWLEEILAQPSRATGALEALDERPVMDEGTQQQRAHSEIVINLAAVILAKSQVS
jgi:protein unc-45